MRNKYSTKTPHPHINKPADRLIGPERIAQRLKELARKGQQTHRLGGYWTVIKGRAVFVRTGGALTPQQRLKAQQAAAKKKKAQGNG